VEEACSRYSTQYLDCYHRSNLIFFQKENTATGAVILYSDLPIDRAIMPILLIPRVVNALANVQYFLQFQQYQQPLVLQVKASLLYYGW
jgi:hypothetical protein